ncbi:MAG: BACON domain-containing carbohydrate-binding protein [Alistipes sp.]|nr:BACON domain-containing carbohydrate-binding protein [Alistipes sp.]
MKSLFKSLMLVAVAAMGFTACQKGSDDVVVLDDVKMTINAAVESNRTVIDEANKRVNWSAGDALKVIENSTTYSTTSAINIAADGTAQFTVSFPAAKTATEFTYNAIYPASQVFEDENVDATRVKVLVKDAQSATATSFDPLADILVSKHIETTAQPTTLDMQFKRLVALGKLTLTNLPASSTISKVTFTAGKEDVLAGRNYVNTVTGAVSEYGYHGNTNAISVSYDEAVASTTPIYFACNPFDMAEGEVFKVEVICSDSTYTREVTIPTGRSLTFVEGDLNTFSVDMTSATKSENFVFPDGEYVIISVNTAGTVYSAMTSVDSGAGTKRFSSTTVEYDGVATIFTTDDETLIWNIKGIDGGYTIQDKDGKYLSWLSGNSAQVQDGSFTLDIVPVDNTAQYNVTCDGGARILAKNSSNPYFAFYTGSGDKNLFLVPVGEVTDPYFEVEGLEDSYNIGVEGDEMWFGDFNKFNGLTSTITASADVDWITIEDLGEEFTITIAANSGALARTGAITFSADGAPDVTTTIRQAGNSSKITVADFLDLKDTTTEYELSGNITRVVDTSYGNFDLTDATGTVYVYGLLTPSGEKQKQWSAAGLKEGDYITIKGVYNVYNNSPQVKNAIYVSHSAISVDKSEISFEADGGSESVTVTLVNVEEQIEATCDNSHFQITKSGNTVTVTAPKNETEDYIVGVLTISAGPVKALINLSQLMPSTGDSEPTWTLVTDVTTLAEGDQIIIAAKNAAVAMSTTQNGNNRGQTAITKVDDNNILATPSSSVQILTLKAGKTSGTWAFHTGSGYLYAASSSKNYLRTQKTLDANASWKISITSAGVATVNATGGNTKNWLRHNSQNSIFSCYGSGQNDIVIYKLQ